MLFKEYFYNGNIEFNIYEDIILNKKVEICNLCEIFNKMLNTNVN